MYFCLPLPWAGIDMGSVAHSVCCSHGCLGGGGGGGAHALLLSFLGAFLLLVLLLLVPAWPIKPQSLVFPSPFCLAWYALPFLLELEGLLCSIISFLVNFFTFSFTADTEASGGYRVFSRPYSLASRV